MPCDLTFQIIKSHLALALFQDFFLFKSYFPLLANSPMYSFLLHILGSFQSSYRNLIKTVQKKKKEWVESGLFGL